MKKIFLSFAIGLVAFNTQAQNINDALLYSQDNMNGTARFRAMGGAFGALGGDFSALNVNPAGSVVFANNQVGFTISNYNIKNNSNYFGLNTTEKDNAFDINQLGGVYVFENEDKSSGWSKFAVALNYDNVNNYDNSIFSAGTNPTNSISNYFLSYANGIPLSTVNGTDYYYGDLFYDEQQAYLGYKSKIIVGANSNPDSTTYTSNVAPGGNYYQENSISTTGYNGKLSFNGSAQYKDRLLVGVNLNAHFSDYRKRTSFFESNNNNTSAVDFVERVRFNNDLYTYGNGFSFQIGTIYKATKEFRLGLAYQSPTWMRYTDELTQNIAAVSSNVDGELPADVVDPQLTMVYEPYRLRTPGKWTGSIAYVFGKTGLISFDYAIKDYSNTSFTPDRDFEDQNNLISNVLDISNEFRVGAEYKIKQFSLRGGYRFEESPYKNGETIGDLTGYSAGIGYNFGEIKVDLAYSYAERDYKQQFFSQGLVDAATINSKNSNISLTMLFEL
ncbi:OmpP1/FadL family transporter [Flavobacterium aquatile]|uniref:Transporter n=1 Tax=Flavobacterium aquatile LMG 4008 = ATCC 11947 TaxID=1453498 RepID=A0A095SV47_9FLAO|nr:outer membrane protein transport protein [Flavobacterium aquatile]KGD68477.1 transporter [Flavobacterium aquatile LMG 4008 = ATCC 11947]OXA68594.1 transporter [Flavobacterium aquatile] [Flavobacterium aquatile LMG 4008 = ATCC 11947]GEC79475.1 transporter [Flavobacterium aquatile]